MKELFKIANEAETRALHTNKQEDWENARICTAIAWDKFNSLRNNTSVVEDDVEYARRVVN
jgi:hypothetical protein